MQNPLPSDVHVNKPLTNISIAYMQDDREFIAAQVFPNVPVEAQSDVYFTFPKGEWFRSEAKERAPGTESAGSGYTVSTAPPYFCRVYAHHKDIPDSVRANQQAPLNVDAEATKFVTRQLLLLREKIWVANYFAAGIWATDVAGVAANPAAGQVLQWSVAGSTPIKDIRTYSREIQRLTGFRPNTLVLGPTVYDVLCDHADILGRIQYTQRGIVTRELLAALFEVDRVLVPGGVENTAAEGAADSMAFMYGKNALLCYAAPSPSLMQPSAGYTFSWTGYLGAGPQGNRITNFRMEHSKSERVEGEMAFDMKVIASDLAVFFSGVIA
ncbi:MAG: hypothetical protein ACM3US_09835 [Sphingomonadaceae bacterium]